MNSPIEAGMPSSSPHILHYGSEPVEFYVDDAEHAETLDIVDTPALSDVAQAVSDALARPIGQNGPFRDTLTPGDTVAILVSDSFRQTRADQMLPPLLDYLNESGIPDTHITITFSTGTHRGPTPEEQCEILGPGTYARMHGRLFTHDPRDETNLIQLGTSRRDTPVWINRRVHEHTHIIATGACVLHYFGGFGGGRKSVVPGIAGVATIAHNHAMNLHSEKDVLDPRVAIGALHGNPVAEDMLEATRLTHVELIINSVLNRDGEIAGLFCGDLVEAHEAACAFARQSFQIPSAGKADLVIAASPSTKNFVQTHKALFNAWQVLKPGGRIVLLAPCREGIGGENFRKWLLHGDRAAIIRGLRRQSEINGQTALSTREKAPSMVLVTEMGDEDVGLLGATKAPTLEAALERTLDELRQSGNSHPTYILMPSAAYTVPCIA